MQVPTFLARIVAVSSFAFAVVACGGHNGQAASAPNGGAGGSGPSTGGGDVHCMDKCAGDSTCEDNCQQARTPGFANVPDVPVH